MVANPQPATTTRSCSRMGEVRVTAVATAKLCTRPSLRPSCAHGRSCGQVVHTAVATAKPRTRGLPASPPVPAPASLRIAARSEVIRAVLFEDSPRSTMWTERKRGAPPICGQPRRAAAAGMEELWPVNRIAIALKGSGRPRKGSGRPRNGSEKSRKGSGRTTGVADRWQRCPLT